MNGAGLGEPPLAGWFQVELTDVSDLALQPLLGCAGAVIDRLGELDLDAAQFVIPPMSSPAAVGTLAQTASWFESSASADRTSVVFVIDCGQDSTIVEVAADVVSGIAKLHQNVLTCIGDATTAVGTNLPLQPRIRDDLWVGPPRHRLVLSGTLAEWTLDAVAWSTELVARSCHNAGIAVPLLLTVRRR